MRLAGGELLTIEGLDFLVGPEALPEAYRVHGRRAGITLLHPWANRLDAPVDGPGVWLDPNGLPIHGLARTGAWDPGGPLRAHFAPHPAFPYAHELSVAVTQDDGLRVETTLTAIDEPVPVAFGWHTYFALGDRSWRLALPARRRLGQDERGIPDGTRHAEPAEDAPLGERTFDDGYEVAPGATLAIGPISVTFDEGYAIAQVFAPADADVVSLEPMTAPTNAVRSGDGLRHAEPGSPFTATFTVRA